LEHALGRDGYDVASAADGASALAEHGVFRPDAVVLDVLMPEPNGLEVCRTLRSGGYDTPILMLTARDLVTDRVAGLDAGADDYLVKPFRLAELLARIRAHLRRRTSAPGDREEPVLGVGAVRVDRAARRAWRDGAELELRPKEFDLLALLVAEAGRAVSRGRIMHDVWDTDWLGSTKTLDTHVLSLRRKLGSGSITTLRGVGYRFERP